MRAFLAINLPKEVQDYLEDLIFKIDKENQRVNIKWVEPENLHLTLGFIENIKEAALNKIKTDLESISVPENLILTLERPGSFPNKEKPRVIKIKILDPEKKLKKIHEAVKDIFQKNGLEVDNRPFLPHITLGRIKTASAKLRYQVETEALSFTVKSIELIKSDLTPAGPIYSILKKFPPDF
ncbi:RNA 2',3'-cyclic phosphodiesterase [Candidatus Kuenenbacteria bacterium]|nr:RNA 2',3'-cyclic phosphodiesterase [Candidatus Kuenenbacteria bacterium]